jgi:5-methylcytosine-specific restriction endonuclease McrA
MELTRGSSAMNAAGAATASNALTMTEPVIPERRRPLTRRQRIDQHDRKGGICCVCGLPIERGEPFIDEHIIDLDLGGTNDDSNRGIAHIPCAKIKTRQGASVRAKVMRVRAKHLGIKKPGRRKIPGRKFNGMPSK